MLRIEDLSAASADVMSAAMLGDGWDSALSRLSQAAGARGVALIRNRDKRLVGALTNREIAEPTAAYVAGKAPASSRQVRVNHDRDHGFRLDHDDYTPAELARDPFYQDFLRPIGMFWHANARLAYEPGEEVAISFKRELAAGPYGRDEARLLDATLRDIKAAIRIAHRVLDAEATGMARMLHLRGDEVFELDSWGRVLRHHGAGDPESAPVRVLNRRLATADAPSQSHLDASVFAATARPGEPAIASLTDGAGRRAYLQVLPVAGSARDVFRSAAALGVVLRPRDPRRILGLDHGILRDIFGLTERENQVALLLLSGLSPAEIAGCLQLQTGTVRFFLKSAFGKTGTQRQAEFVSLLSRLLP